MPKLKDIVWYGRYGVQVVRLPGMTDTRGYHFQRGYVKIWRRGVLTEPHVVDTALTVANARKRIAGWNKKARTNLSEFAADGTQLNLALGRLADR
jgi:hypothetical protein